ncbi:MAG: oxaloacetate decarboxylase subunit alpha [Candidatus Muproteobacteria bacterium RBG_16_64_11]|uniref:Oxaloacetate decarboxylase subunit alpha n=1 Tax=Candidatus Muproteobacteria bacterium RBG_16_64_11 TaxID=1817758 RepID=A0A1F6TFQ7_9PROT|nr:MAG: oxaloacetate decarboxylase subunit alpha [Candidatus Muproteobacteria bacterium RBG_16_64_11]
MASNKNMVHVTDLILRDAHQSLLATRMRTEDMLPICPKLDKVGYWSLEAWGGATFDACLRFLKEDPWERLRSLKKALPNTPIQMLLRGQNLLGYRHYSDDVVEAFVKKAAMNGVDVFRIFDAMNDLRNVEVSIKAVIKAGKHAQGAICYTTSPVHTIEHFVEQAVQLEKMGCHTIAIKDMAGLITPARAAELFAALSKAVKLPLHFHSHTTVGIANISMYKAVENGARHVDTTISSMSWGTSHSPTESMVVAFRDTPYDTGLDLPLLQEIGMYFHEVRKKYHQYESEFNAIDTRVQVNQVPGGMISNLSHQLKEQGALTRMHEVLAEIPRVREDLGYPPLVTPTSQIVGTQAVLNVLTGSRYKSITNEVKLYLQGRYGQAPGKINDAVRKMAIGDEEVIACRPADRLKPEMDRLRQDIGALAESEEDVLSYAMFPEIGRKFLEERAAGTLRPEELLPLPGAQATATASPLAPTEFNVTVHGETYHLKITGAGHRTAERRPFYVSVDGMPEEILVETLQEVVPTEGGMVDTKRVSKTSRRPKASREGHVTTAMPGTVVDILVKPGDTLKAGDAVLVIEAMKMENEVPAPIAGRVKAVHVAKGDSVNPDEALVEIE